MKRFLFIVFIGFIALMIFMSEYEPADQPLPKKLEQAIKQTRMMEYHDDDYDYVVRHPQFFEQTADSLMDKGACRFTFWKDSVEVVQSAFVEPNTDSLTTPQAVKKYTSDLHATCQRMGDDFFILSGALHSDTGMITGSIDKRHLMPIVSRTDRKVQPYRPISITLYQQFIKLLLAFISII